jgi:signal transduction histidine kinase
MPTPSRLGEHRLARLIDVGRTLVSELELDAVLERLLDVATELTGARYAALGILDRSRTELERFLARRIDEQTRAAIGDLPQGHGLLGVLIDDPRPLRLDDVGAHPRSYGFPPAHPAMRTFLGVPILLRGRPWGNLYLTEKEDGEPFSAEDEDAVVVLADWASIAIENARLYGDAVARRDELAHAARRLDATAAIARAVGGETELDRVLELVVKRGRALVEARDVLILLREDDVLVVAAGAGEASGLEHRRLPFAGSTSGEVMAAGRPRRIADAGAEMRIAPERLGARPASAALLAPLVYRGSPLGVLIALDRVAHGPAFTDDDEQVLDAFAAQAAVAVATAKTVEADRLRRSLHAAEAERRRWARELHDETLQGLGGLKVLLSSATRLDDVASMRAAMREAAGQVSRDIEALRGLITELRPAALDELGLGPALTSLVHRTAVSSGLDVRAAIDVAEHARLKGELETTVYRIVQEALTNVVKHAEATGVDVGVRCEDGEVRITVADDGVGLDGERGGGYGLIGMHERVEMAGGELAVERGDAGGTFVRARLPVR